MNAMVPNQVMEMVSIYPPSSKDQKGIEKTWSAGDLGVQDIVGENVPHPGKVITSLSSQWIKTKTKIMVKI